MSVGAGGEGVPSGQRFLLKWSVPLSFVEVVEFGSSEEMGDSRFPPSHSGDKVVINAKPSKFLLYRQKYVCKHICSVTNSKSDCILVLGVIFIYHWRSRSNGGLGSKLKTIIFTFKH